MKTHGKKTFNILKFGDDLRGAMVGQNQQRKKRHVIKKPLHLTKKGLKPHDLGSMMKRIQTRFKTHTPNICNTSMDYL
jgi:hypothetical protein